MLFFVCCKFYPACQRVSTAAVFHLTLTEATDSHSGLSKEKDQFADDVDDVCIFIRAQKITSVSVCPAAFPYTFGLINLSGFSWFCS